MVTNCRELENTYGKTEKCLLCVPQNGQTAYRFEYMTEFPFRSAISLSYSITLIACYRITTFTHCKVKDYIM